jgi:hypothetical protein
MEGAVMACNYCDDMEVLHVENAEEMLDFLMEFLTETEQEDVAVVADEGITKQLLYHSVNSEYNINRVELDPHGYDDGYIFTLSWDGDNYEVDIEKAKPYEKFLACGYMTFVQIDFEHKCEYIWDVTHNNYVKPELEFFTMGDIVCEDDESDEPDKAYTYANEIRDDDGEFYLIFVSSTDPDYVDYIKEDFEEMFDE